MAFLVCKKGETYLDLVLCDAEYSVETDNLILEQTNQNNRMEGGDIDALFAVAVCVVFFTLTFRADC
jgi:hypothetical protein